MMPMNPGSKASAVLRVLSEGPATSGEVAVSLGIDPRIAGAHLCNLRRKGRVRVEAARIATGGRPARLWRVAA
jgi:predicted ArsR family transcriptional regulator